MSYNRIDLYGKGYCNIFFPTGIFRVVYINSTEIVNLEERWNVITNLSLEHTPINDKVFCSLIRDTFRILSTFDECTTIPKSISRVLILMAEFASYSLMSEDNTGLDTVVIHMITIQLLWSFTNGFQTSGSSYPKLKMHDDFNVKYINVETNDLLNLQIDTECLF